jgi:putative tricarboxylic transport membrane protein
MIGAYSLRNSAADILIMVVFGVLGYLMRKLRYEAAPLVMAFVLGPLLELNLRRSLIMSDGSFLIFFQRPISSVILIVAFVILFLSVFPIIKWNRPQPDDVI